MEHEYLAETIRIRTECGLSLPIAMAGQTLPFHQGQWLFSVTDEGQRKMDIMLLLGDRSRASDNQLLGNICIDLLSDGRRNIPKVSLSLSVQRSGALLVSVESLMNGSVRCLRAQLKTSGAPVSSPVERVEDIRFREFAKTGALARKMIRTNTITLQKAFNAQ